MFGPRKGCSEVPKISRTPDRIGTVGIQRNGASWYPNSPPPPKDVAPRKCSKPSICSPCAGAGDRTSSPLHREPSDTWLTSTMLASDVMKLAQYFWKRCGLHMSCSLLYPQQELAGIMAQYIPAECVCKTILQYASGLQGWMSSPSSSISTTYFKEIIRELYSIYFHLEKQYSMKLRKKYTGLVDSERSNITQLFKTCFQRLFDNIERSPS